MTIETYRSAFIDNPDLDLELSAANLEGQSEYIHFTLSGASNFDISNDELDFEVNTVDLTRALDLIGANE